APSVLAPLRTHYSLPVPPPGTINPNFFSDRTGTGHDPDANPSPRGPAVRAGARRPRTTPGPEPAGVGRRRAPPGREPRPAGHHPLPPGKPDLRGRRVPGRPPRRLRGARRGGPALGSPHGPAGAQVRRPADRPLRAGLRARRQAPGRVRGGQQGPPVERP